MVKYLTKLIQVTEAKLYPMFKTLAFVIILMELFQTTKNF